MVFVFHHLVGGLCPQAPPQVAAIFWMKISLPRHDLLGEEKWPIYQRRRARNLFLNELLLDLICRGVQGVHIKLINLCQAEMIK